MGEASGIFLEFEYAPNENEMWVPYRGGWIVIQMENRLEDVIRFVCDFDNSVVLDKNKVDVQVENRIDGTITASDGSVNIHKSLSDLVVNGILYHIRVTL